MLAASDAAFGARGSQESREIPVAKWVQRENYVADDMGC